MADNTVLNPGSGGDTIAADDVGGVKYQYVKLDVGAGGASSPVVGSLPVSGTFYQATQPVSAASLPLPSDASTETTLAALNTKVTAVNTGAVVVSSSALPSGASTETTLAALNTKIPASPATEGGNLATLVTRTPVAGQTTMAASSPVVIASDQSTLAVNQAGVTATGSITALNANLSTGVPTANSSVALSLNGATGFSIDIRGTFVATLLIQGSVTGNDWITLSVLPIGAGLNIAQVASVTAVGAWWGNSNGLQQIRVTCSAFTSGTVTPTLRAMPAAGMVFTLPAGQTSQAVSVPASTNLIGDVGIQYRANATGAALTSKFTSAATVNNALILTGARRLLGWTLTNTTASFKYFRFYNKATAPTSGESPTFMVGLPPNSTVIDRAEGGIAMTLGLGIACTGAVADTDATVTAVADVIGAIFYI
jgi:hypothetical protein